MQKGTPNDHQLPIKKKKKNKGWDTPSLQPEEVSPPSGSPSSELTSKEIHQSTFSQPKIDLSSKQLKEMGKDYHIEMGMQVGSGFASVVYLGENIHSHEIVCVKVIDCAALGGQTAKGILSRQIRYLNHFNSKHIVRLYDVYQSLSFCYLVMEYCPGGDLYRFLLNSEVLHPLFVRKLIQQICQGLIELKSKSLIHRDLKTQNIFLGKNFEAKIGDLGFCVTSTEENIIKNVGSPIYMSPEVLQGASHTFQSDVYGLGVIWYELLYKQAPWSAKTEEELLQKKLNQKVEFLRSDIPQDDINFVQKCLALNPKDRCSAEEILEYCLSVNNKEMSLLKQSHEKNPISAQGKEYAK